MNVAEVLRDTRRTDPSATALRDSEQRVDYLALEMAAQRVATVIGQGSLISAGDRVALLLPSIPEFAFALYGVLWAGAVAVTLKPGISPDSLRLAVRRSAPKLIIAWHAYAELVDAVAQELAIDRLFVEPREFSHLLAAVTPRAPLAAVEDDHPAAVLGVSADRGPIREGGLSELHHGQLLAGARAAGEKMELGPGDLVSAPRSLVDPEHQVWALHAAVAYGAAVLLGNDPHEPGPTVALAGPGRFRRVAPAAQATPVQELA